jgi:hypothetical protein
MAGSVVGGGMSAKQNINTCAVHRLIKNHHSPAICYARAGSTNLESMARTFAPQEYIVHPQEYM